MITRIFLHGLESSNQGTKSIFFRDLYPDMLLPNFRGSLQERVKKLDNVLSGKSGIKIVGSSFGGLMASIYAMQNEEIVDTLVLLAPALNLFWFSKYGLKEVHIPVHIFHGTDDEVIPIESVKNIAEKVFPNLTFHTVKDDHFLHRTFKTIDWYTLLK